VLSDCFKTIVTLIIGIFAVIGIIWLFQRETVIIANQEAIASKIAQNEARTINIERYLIMLRDGES